MELAARRVLWGKVTNAGQVRGINIILSTPDRPDIQVCVSPDYVLVPYEAQLILL